MAKLDDKLESGKKFGGLTQEFFDEKAQQSKDNRLSGNNNDVEISLVDTHTVRFKENFGFMEKGKEYTISEMAYQVYDKKKLVEKV